MNKKQEIQETMWSLSSILNSHGVTDPAQVLHPDSSQAVPHPDRRSTV